MAEIFLHVGLYKSASTLIQSVAEQNEAALAAAGIALWSHTFDGRHFRFPDRESTLFEADQIARGGYPQAAMAVRARAEADNPVWARAVGRYLTYHAPLGRERKQALKDRVNQAIDASGMTRLLISSEFFGFSSFSRHAPASNLDAGLDDLCTIFGDHKLHIILILRRQFDLLKSLYNQIIKGNFITSDFPGWLDSVRPVIDSGLDLPAIHGRYIERLSADRVHISFFEQLKDDDIGFLGSVFRPVARGVTFSGHKDDNAINRSLSPAALEIMRSANALISSERDKHIMMQAMQHIQGHPDQNAALNREIDQYEAAVMAPFLEGNHIFFSRLPVAGGGSKWQDLYCSSINT